MEFSSDLKEIASNEGIENPIITITKTIKPGEGFLGDYSIANIHGNEKSLSLFLKRPPKSDDESIKDSMRSIHLNEFLFYETIYPQFIKFERERDCEIFKSVAKCYKIISEKNHEVMILDNMRAKGFKCCKKKEPLDDDHMKLMLEEFAHFHAISFAFKDQEPEEFKRITKHIGWLASDVVKEDFEHTVEYFMKNVLKNLDSNNFHGYDLFESFTKNIKEFLTYLDELEDRFHVINHMDITYNNILFQYDDSIPEKPINVCFLDWQLTKVTSPVIDLSYFFYGSCSINQMKNIEFYLDFYYDKLSYYMNLLGSDINVLYSKQDFYEEWKNLARFGLAMCTIVIKLILTEPHDIPSNHEKTSMFDTLSYKIKNEKLYYEKVQSVVSHFIEKGYLGEREKINCNGN